MSYRSSGYVNHEPDMSRVFTHSYLTAEPSQGYLKRPLEPRAPKSPQFHRPPGMLLNIKIIIFFHNFCENFLFNCYHFLIEFILISFFS